MNLTPRRAVFATSCLVTRGRFSARFPLAALTAGAVLLAGSLARPVYADTSEAGNAAVIPAPSAPANLPLATPTTASDPLRFPLRGDATRPSLAEIPVPKEEGNTAQAEPKSLDARLAQWGLKSNLNVDSIMQKHGLRSVAPNLQLGLVPRPVPLAVRLGVALSPRTRFVGGLDAVIPSLSIGRGFNTRVDLDAIVAANFGGITTLIPLTFDQVYNIRLPGGAGLYVGGGIGPYFGEVTRFGGKLFIGGEITSHFGLEGTVHFQGYGDAITTVQARFPF